MNDVAQLAGPIMTAAALASPPPLSSPPHPHHPGAAGMNNFSLPAATAPAAGFPTVYNLSAFLQGKDSRWLQLEVCREFTRHRCTRSDTDCRYAHPPLHVEVNGGKVTACYDSFKGRCTRTEPPCKYFHPPPHLRDQLQNNGKNTLAFRNMVLNQLAYAATGGQQAVSALPTMMQNNKAAMHSVLPPGLSFYDPSTLAGAPYLTSAVGHYGLLSAAGTPLVPLALTAQDAAALASVNMMPQTVVGNHVLQNPQKAGRQDPRVDSYTGGIPAGTAALHSAAAAAAAAAAANSPYKRAATGDKAGMTMYQHQAAQTGNAQTASQHQHQQAAAAAAAYQQAVALMSLQQPFVPATVTCEYNSPLQSVAMLVPTSVSAASSMSPPLPPHSSGATFTSAPSSSAGSVTTSSAASVASTLLGAPLTAAYFPAPQKPTAAAQAAADYRVFNHYQQLAAAAAAGVRLPPQGFALPPGLVYASSQSPPPLSSAASQGANNGLSAALAAAAAAAAAHNSTSQPPAKKMKRE